MFGFKIYDEENKFEQLKSVLRYLNNEKNKNIPLEIGSYHKKEIINEYIKDNSNLIENINGHCSSKSNIIRLANDKSIFNYIENELLLFKFWNAKYSVIHIANEWMPNRKEIIKDYVDFILPSII